MNRTKTLAVKIGFVLCGALLGYATHAQPSMSVAVAVPLPTVEVVCFSTNSSRRPSVVPSAPGARVVYLASAGKPLRTTAYQRFPRPGVVIGDQVATDGILARRLGYAFVLFDPQLTGIPTGPRLMGAWGRLVRPLLFSGPASE